MELGCDASILIDSTKDNTAEKDSPANLSLRGYELIDEVKEELEHQCPGVVSCADIVAMAARDAVFFAGGPVYDIPKGRKDIQNRRDHQAAVTLHECLRAHQSIWAARLNCPRYGCSLWSVLYIYNNNKIYHSIKIGLRENRRLGTRDVGGFVGFARPQVGSVSTVCGRKRCVEAGQSDRAKDNKRSIPPLIRRPPRREGGRKRSCGNLGMLRCGWWPATTQVS
ncbi:hypothetical protein CsatB_010925 [Cannabis sativa]